ncbi:hypothetical protein FDF08_02755 [Micrococcus luteus]|nr:hypothetical protein FDF08_02755 [Micrococcus luteus]
MCTFLRDHHSPGPRPRKPPAPDGGGEPAGRRGRASRRGAGGRRRGRAPRPPKPQVTREDARAGPPAPHATLAA